MSEAPLGVDAEDQSVRQMLSGQKYSIGFYQREYRWDREHVEDIINDLEGSFLESHDIENSRSEVKNYRHYFLGSTIISRKSDTDDIIDGQQRLTTLTLILIYLFHRQDDQGIDKENQVSLQNLIFSAKYGERTFNLQVDEREACMEALFKGEIYDPSDASESVKNINERYHDIEEIFPESLQGDNLLFFIDWLLDNVDLVKITTYSDEDAYRIFEHMNDRGLRLNPTEMLKGYLLANIRDEEVRAKANELWKKRVHELIKVGKEEEIDFFKSWLRSQFAESMRQRKKGAKNEDFEIIGTAYHEWVRNNNGHVGLRDPKDFEEFIEVEFDFFCNRYIDLKEASSNLVEDFEYVYYNNNVHFTLQYPLILSPLKSSDDDDIILRKTRLVSKYIDIFVARRIVNRRAIYRSAIEYTMFNLIKDIRELDVFELAETLKQEISDMDETFDAVSNFIMHQQNKSKVHHLLARITSHIERKSGMDSSFAQYVSSDIDDPYQVEHIWANKYERHDDEFETENEFDEYRNRFGNLLLLPKSFNQSYGADPYSDKVEHYFGQNLLAKSLNPRCYERNPGFRRFMDDRDLPFKPHEEFKRKDVDERQELMRQLCEEVWAPERLDAELEGL